MSSTSSTTAKLAPAAGKPSGRAPLRVKRGVENVSAAPASSVPFPRSNSKAATKATAKAPASVPFPPSSTQDQKTTEEELLLLRDELCRARRETTKYLKFATAMEDKHQAELHDAHGKLCKAESRLAREKARTRELEKEVFVLTECKSVREEPSSPSPRVPPVQENLGKMRASLYVGQQCADSDDSVTQAAAADEDKDSAEKISAFVTGLGVSGSLGGNVDPNASLASSACTPLEYVNEALRAAILERDSYRSTLEDTRATYARANATHRERITALEEARADAAASLAAANAQLAQTTADLEGALAKGVELERARCKLADDLAASTKRTSMYRDLLHQSQQTCAKLTATLEAKAKKTESAERSLSTFKMQNSNLRQEVRRLSLPGGYKTSLSGTVSKVDKKTLEEKLAEATQTLKCVEEEFARYKEAHTKKLADAIDSGDQREENAIRDREQRLEEFMKNAKKRVKEEKQKADDALARLQSEQTLSRELGFELENAHQQIGKWKLAKDDVAASLYAEQEKTRSLEVRVAELAKATKPTVFLRRSESERKRR